MKALDLGYNCIAYIRGKRQFRCCRCMRRYAIFQQRHRVISITTDIANELGRQELVGKLEFVPFCTHCYPVTKYEF